jgi:hypothetical protein
MDLVDREHRRGGVVDGGRAILWSNTCTVVRGTAVKAY